MFTAAGAHAVQLQVDYDPEILDSYVSNPKKGFKRRQATVIEEDEDEEEDKTAVYEAMPFNTDIESMDPDYDAKHRFPLPTEVRTARCKLSKCQRSGVLGEVISLQQCVNKEDGVVGERQRGTIQALQTRLEDQLVREHNLLPVLLRAGLLPLHPNYQDNGPWRLPHVSLPQQSMTISNMDPETHYQISHAYTHTLQAQFHTSLCHLQQWIMD